MASQAIVLVSLVALCACQFLDGEEPATARERLGLAPAAPADDYPSLHGVPPRARLSYSVEQRRAIVDGLVADRENARYTDQVVRYRSGQSSLPPPPAPPHDLAAVDTEGLLEPDPEIEAQNAPDEPPSPFDDDAGFAGVYDDGDDEDSLDSFVEDLASDPAATQADDAAVPLIPAEPATTGDGDGGGFMEWLGDLLSWAEPAAPAAPGATSEVTTVPAMQPTLVAQNAAAAEPAYGASEAPPARPDPGDHGIAIGVEGVAIESERAGGPRGVVGGGEARFDEPPPTTATLAPTTIAVEAAAPAKPEVAPLPPIGALAGHITFAPGSAALPESAGVKLEQVLAAAKAQGAMIRILGEAPAPALALDRARAVGLALVKLGAGAGDLQMTLAHEATGDQAQLVLARPGAR